MSDEKPKSDPVDDLKQGLGLLFRAAKGAVEKLPTDKVEDVAKDAAKEVARAFETIGHEVEKVISPGAKKGSQPPAADANAKPSSTPPTATGTGEAKPPEGDAPKFDDAYAPEQPPKR
jgi:hypothetical protein